MADSKPSPTPALDARRLERLGRKLDSWDVLLGSEGRVSGASERDLVKRRKRLAELRLRYEALRLGTSEAAFVEPSSTIELPPLGLCNEDERELCEQYLDARLKILTHMREHLTKVMEWVDQAVSLQKAGWRVKWRLNKIRRYLNQLETERQRLDPHRTAQTHHWEQLADRLLLYRDPHIDTSDTRLAFEKIVNLTHRVAELQQKVHQLQGKTSRMDQWLKQAARRLHSLKPPEPPLADDLRLITQKIDQIGLEDLHRSRSRLSVARRYLEKYLGTPNAEEEAR